MSLDLKHEEIELDPDNLTLVPVVQRSDREWVFRLGTLEIAAQSEDDMREWVNKIQETLLMNKVKVGLTLHSLGLWFEMTIVEEQ